MGSAMYISSPFSPGTVSVSGARGKITVHQLTSLKRGTLPDDPVATVQVRFSGVRTGSEIKLFDINRALLGGTESASGTPQFTLNRFALGSPLNTVRALINSLSYEILDFNFELTTADLTIPVFQRIDRNYRNPQG